MGFNLNKTVQYGDYIFDYVRLKVATENKFEDNNKVLLYTTYTFTVNGEIIEDTPAAFKTAMDQFRAAMSAPRKKFTVISDGKTVYNITASTIDKSQDILFGPNVKNFNINEFTGGLAASYEVTIEATIKGCTGDVPDILRHTVDEEFTINADGFTRRTTSGQIWVIQQARPADNFRKNIVVNIPVNFKRVEQNFKCSDDGIRLDYQIIDEEVYNTLPKNITSGNCDFQISTDKGAKLTITLSGEMGCKAGVNKKESLAAIMNLLKRYMGPFLNGNNSFVWERQELKTNVYSNIISFNFSGWAAGQVVLDPNDANNNAVQNLIDPPPDSNGISEFIEARGKAGLVAGTQPVIDCKNPYVGSQTNPPPIPPPTRDNPTTDPGSSSKATTQSGLTSEHINYLYIDYHESVSYEVDTKIKIFMPKYTGNAPLVQQITDEEYYITQVGYASRVGKQPQVPPPVVQAPGAYIMQASISPSMPTKVSGTDVYQTSWRYIIRVVDNKWTIPNNAVMSIDPRFEGMGTPKKIENLPQDLTQL